MTKRMQKILLGFSLLLAVPLVAGYGLYYGYCHSWWGKDNLLFRSMWLCSCPAGFEETLYPDYVEVVFSACNEVEIELVVPDNSIFLVKGDETTPEMPVYVWDPIIGEKTPYLYDQPLLSNNFTIDRSGNTPYVVEWRTGKNFPLLNINGNSEPDPQYIVNDQPTAKLLDMLYPPMGRLILLNDADGDGDVNIYSIPTSENDPNQIAFFVSEQVEKGVWIKAFLETNNIPYENRSLTSDRHISPNRKFKASVTSVINVETNQVILDFTELQEEIRHRNCPYKDSFEFCPILYGAFWQGDSQAIFISLNHLGPQYIVFPWEVGVPIQNEMLTGPVLRLSLPTP